MYSYNNNLNSIYRAKVISNKDPLEIGRVQIRVPSIHGTDINDGLRDEALPYASPCVFDASFESGSFIVPEVNSTVFVFFEGGEPSKPVYFGNSISYEHTESQYVGNSDTNLYQNSDGKRIKRAYTSDVPKNVYRGGIFRKFILFKSRKGSSIEFCDDDDNEHLSIFDRLGQTLTMFAPIDKSNNSDGLANRGLFSVIKTKATLDGCKKAILLLKSLSSSFLRFVSKEDYTQNDFITVYKDDNAGISVDIGKDDRLIIHYKNKSKIELKDNEINIQASNINIKGDLKVDGKILSNSTIKGDIYGTPCVCEGRPCNYSFPESLNFNDIKPYEDSNDESIIDE